MKKGYVIAFSGLLTTCSLTALFYVYKDWKQHAVPQRIRKIADDAIIDRVGRKYFSDNFTYDARASYVAVSPGYYTGYTVSYHFRQLQKYTDRDIITVILRDDKVEAIIGVPLCDEDQSKCQFNLSKEEAFTVTRRNGFNASDLKLNWTPYSSQGLALEFRSCDKNMVMYVDYRDGRVLEYKPEAVCGGDY